MNHKSYIDQLWDHSPFGSGSSQCPIADIDTSFALGNDGSAFQSPSPINIPNGSSAEGIAAHVLNDNRLDHEAHSFGGSWDEIFPSPRNAFSLPDEPFSWSASFADGYLWQNESQSSHTNQICSMPEFSAIESFDGAPSTTRPQLADFSYDSSYDPAHKPDSLFSIGSLDSTLDSLDLDTNFGSLDSSVGPQYVPVAAIQRTTDQHNLSRVRPTRKPRGRKGPLAPKVREEASKMRGLGACQTCKRRKAKCDDGVYCKACINHLGEALLVQPGACRGRALEELTDALLTGQVFPRKRPPVQFLGHDFTIDPQASTVGLTLGFGAPLHVQIKLVRPSDARKLIHEHIEYPWQTTNLSLCSVGEKTIVRHAVFPAVLIDDTSAQFRAKVDEHLGVLLDKEENFTDFPLYRSDLVLLREVYILYKDLTIDDALLLREVLKLLIAVHIGGDISIDKNCHCSSRQSASIFHPCNQANQLAQLPSPCLIRSQLGPVLQCLAKNYMRTVLQQLGRLSLSPGDGKPAVVRATYIVLLMALESIQFHAAKQNYHAIFDQRTVEYFQHPQMPSSFDCVQNVDGAEHSFRHEIPHGMTSGTIADDTNSKRDIAIDRLMDFYSASLGSGGASAKTLPTRSRSSSNAKQSSTRTTEACETFLNRVAGAAAKAEQYLQSKRRAVGGSHQNAGFYFDRLLARFFVL